MKIIIFYLIFVEMVLSCLAATYDFPPFNAADLSFSQKEIEERLRVEPSFYEKDLQELRSIMTFGDYGAQQQAAKVLIEAGDHETILRVVYTLKQGSLIGVDALGGRTPRQVIPYMMEDVAHGSMEDFGGNLMHVPYGKVRFAATEIVASILREIEEFPEPTREWLKYVKSGNGNKDINDLAQKSKFLVEWWILNEQAFLAGKWDEVVPVPHAGTYPPPPKPQFLPEGELPPGAEDEPPTPWKFTPLEVPESFEDWSARIVHPERRDLRWVKLTFENGKWVEHPAVRLDPPASATEPSRNVRRPTPSVAPGLNDTPTQWPVLIACLAVLSGLFFWWWIRKPKAV